MVVMIRPWWASCCWSIIELVIVAETVVVRPGWLRHLSRAVSVSLPSLVIVAGWSSVVRSAVIVAAIVVAAIWVATDIGWW